MENKRAIVITPFMYRSQCDTYMCKNQAKHSIGLENTPVRTTHNLCDECLPALAVVIPKDTIINNPHVVELVKSNSLMKKQIKQLEQQLNKLTETSTGA